MLCGWSRNVEDKSKMADSCHLEQENCAVTKITARCALYMNALKVFETPSRCLWILFQIVLIPVLGYAHAPLFPKVLLGFCSDGPYECSAYECSAYECSGQI